MFPQRNQCAGTEGRTKRDKVFLKVSHWSYLIGLSSVFQQQGDDIGMALLSGLVQRGVAHLEKKRGKDGQTHRKQYFHLWFWHLMQIPVVPNEIEIVYPCLAIHMSLLLQKELHHLDVAIVTGHMKGCVAHLRQGERFINASFKTAWISCKLLQTWAGKIVKRQQTLNKLRNHYAVIKHIFIFDTDELVWQEHML